MTAPVRRVVHVMRMTGVSGSENHLAVLIGALDQYGWRSDVLIPTPQPGALTPLLERLRACADRVEVIPMRSDVSPSLVWRLTRALRSGRYDIAHAHLVHADWHLALASVFAGGVPLVSTKHNPDPFRSGRVFRLVEGTALRRFSRVVVISDALRAFVAQTLGTDAITVRYGLEAPARPPARPAREVSQLVAVGRLEKQKGYDVAIEAMRAAVREVPGVQLAIAGEGRLRPSLKAAIERAGLQESVRLLGRVDDVHELMREADLFVHTARWEGFGLVLLEAMSAALPIIGTRVGAIPEVVEDGVTGILVPPDDPVALAEAVVALVRDPERARTLGLGGFERLRREFSPDAMARGIAGVYDGLLERR